jgi:ATP-dependent DNA helicase DinG
VLSYWNRLDGEAVFSATMGIMEKYFEILGQFSRYERREAQERMVAKVAESLAQKQTLVVEAGTGSGKSFGYLIPALYQQSQAAAGEKKPVVISTATIALQEQLLQKDIPFLAKASGIDNLTAKLVKGRGNYICIQKLLDVERQVKPNSREMLHVQFLKSELANGWNGDVAELSIALPPEFWKEVRSDSEDCLGRKCRFYDENPYRKAREDLDQADILVANHALYLQDIGAGQSILPPHDTVIFDEAHQLKHYALSAFTVRIGKFATQKLLQKIHRRLQPIPEQFHHLIADSEAAIFEWLFRSEQSTFRLYPDELFLYLINKQIQVLQELEKWLVGLDVKQLTLIRPDMFESELDMDKAKVQREKLISQLQGLIARWEFFLEEDPFTRQRVNWAEVDKERLYYELKSTPLNISDMMRNLLWKDKNAVLTSATLSVNHSLNFVRKDLGIDEGNDLVLPSPFKYEEQCVLYLPENLPEPNSDAFLMAITDEIERVLRLSRGRAFVLFTSNSAMQRVSHALIPQLPYPCRVQGDLPRNRLIDWFKQTPNSIIFATSTFWEGIDIPGEALSCVIIDKIPFSPPGDPVHQAVTDFLKSRGEDWFSQYALPQAVIKLKQGFGRLIRSGTDKGLVAIMDPRIRRKGYGKIIQRSLPAVQIVDSLDHVRAEIFN